jgi:hypothetical protein
MCPAHPPRLLCLDTGEGAEVVIGRAPALAVDELMPPLSIEPSSIGTTGSRLVTAGIGRGFAR